MNRVKQHYMTIYSIAYSSDGDYLIAGNNYGGIAVFNLAKAFEASFSLGCDEKLKFPLFKFEAHKFPVYSLASSKKLIFSGSTGDVIAWSWSDMKKRDSKQSWCLAIVEKNSIRQKDVNSLALSSVDDTTLYAACDDKVYGIDIKAGTILFSLSGHTDYIHCLAAMGSQECASASEDGSVRTWDARVDGSEIHIIEPYKIKGLHRSKFGKWIGCVAVNESNEWMTCGGGPMLCTWHLGTMLPATKLEKTDSITTPHVVQFCDDRIISGGPQSGTDVWAFDGKLCAEIPTSGSCIYGLSAYSTSSEKILGISGNGYKIDISRDLRIRELSLMYTL